MIKQFLVITLLLVSMTAQGGLGELFHGKKSKKQKTGPSFQELTEQEKELAIENHKKKRAKKIRATEEILAQLIKNNAALEKIQSCKDFLMLLKITDDIVDAAYADKEIQERICALEITIQCIEAAGYNINVTNLHTKLARHKQALAVSSKYATKDVQDSRRQTYLWQDSKNKSENAAV